MGFLFGLFRFLTWGNIAIQAFLLFFALLAAFFQPVMGAFYLMVFGVVFYHNFLCLQLQRSLKDPAVPLRPTFSPSIILFSILSFIIAMLTFRLLFVIVTPEGRGAFIKGMMEGARGNKEITPELVNSVFNFLISLVTVYGLAIATNCILSSVFLNRWKKSQEQEQEDADTFLDV